MNGNGCGERIERTRTRGERRTATNTKVVFCAFRETFTAATTHASRARPRRCHHSFPLRPGIAARTLWGSLSTFVRSSQQWEFFFVFFSAILSFSSRASECLQVISKRIKGEQRAARPPALRSSALGSWVPGAVSPGLPYSPRFVSCRSASPCCLWRRPGNLQRSKG